MSLANAVRRVCNVVMAKLTPQEIESNPDTRPERLVSVHITGPTTEGVTGDREFFDLTRDDAVVDLVEQLIGPDVILWGCQAFCKPPGDGMEVPWHQRDSQQTRHPHRPERTLEKREKGSAGRLLQP